MNPTAQLFGIDFDLTILSMSLLTVLITFLIIFISSRNMQLKPKGKQNVLEWVYEFVQGIIKPNLGRYTSNYSLLFFSLFFFMAFSLCDTSLPYVPQKVKFHLRVFELAVL